MAGGHAVLEPHVGEAVGVEVPHDHVKALGWRDLILLAGLRDEGGIRADSLACGRAEADNELVWGSAFSRMYGGENRVLSVGGTPTQLRLLDRKVASGLNAEAPNSAGRCGVVLGKRRRAARAVYHERGPGYDIAMFVCRPECDNSLVDDLNATPDAFSVLVVR